jgi:pantothenate kinase
VSGRLAALAEDLLRRAEGRRRFVLAIAGAPGSGKSTFAEALLEAALRRAPGSAALLPMDGFHLDDALLEARGWRARKGAPHTFDVDGLAAALGRIRAADRPVLVPVFDRAIEIARAGAREIPAEAPLVLVEGNYMLLDEPPWSGLAPLFDATLFLDVPEATLRARLTARWIGYGLTPEGIRAKLEENDLPNARLVARRSRPPDILWRDAAAEGLRRAIA